MLRDDEIIRGRPNGRFKKWQLNQYGFRGPEITKSPPEGCTRIMVLGASEAFGLYESPQNEFPSQLQRVLAPRGSFEVINATLPGMSLASVIQFWSKWASQFRPHIVVVYVSPLFYLGDSPPSFGKPPQRGFSVGESKNRVPQSRLWEHLKDRFEMPEFIQDWRDKWKIEQRVSGHAPEWFFVTAPPDRLALYREHLRLLCDTVSASGAKVCLITHAYRIPSIPTPEELSELEAARVAIPRATTQGMAAFHESAAQTIRDLGNECGVVVIDAAKVLNGKSEYFADLVHFNDAGAGGDGAVNLR